MDDSYTIRVGDGPEFQLSQKQLAPLDLIQTDRDRFHLIYKGKGYRVEVVASDFFAGRYVLQIDGREYESSVKTPLDGLIQKMGFATNGPQDINDIIAPMPGLLLDIQVQEGQPVEEGDRLLVLEAMKMENIIASPREGTIKKIHVKKGDTVDKKQLLLEFF